MSRQIKVLCCTLFTLLIHSDLTAICVQVEVTHPLRQPSPQLSPKQLILQYKLPHGARHQSIHSAKSAVVWARLPGAKIEMHLVLIYRPGKLALQSDIMHGDQHSLSHTAIHTDGATSQVISATSTGLRSRSVTNARLAQLSLCSGRGWPLRDISLYPKLLQMATGRFTWHSAGQTSSTDSSLQIAWNNSPSGTRDRADPPATPSQGRPLVVHDHRLVLHQRRRVGLRGHARARLGRHLRARRQQAAPGLAEGDHGRSVAPHAVASAFAPVRLGREGPRLANPGSCDLV